MSGTRIAVSEDVTLLQIHLRGGSTNWTLRYCSAWSKLIVTITLRLRFRLDQTVAKDITVPSRQNLIGLCYSSIQMEL